MEKMGRDRKREPAAVDETGKRERESLFAHGRVARCPPWDYVKL